MRRTLEERFWPKVDKRGPDECWPWTASTTTDGYGRIGLDGRIARAHRLAYELLVGPIPEGLQLDHLCRNRACVNPAHLEPVTNHENQLRGYGASGRNARITHCPHGHEYTPENTYLSRRKYGVARICRRCYNDNTNARRRRNRAKRRAASKAP